MYSAWFLAILIMNKYEMCFFDKKYIFVKVKLECENVWQVFPIQLLECLTAPMYLANYM